MKKEIHPPYYKDAQIHCACGNVIKVGSTRKKMQTEICSACHPFYTGKKKLVDSLGQIDRFKKKLEKTQKIKSKKKKQKKTAPKTKNKKTGSKK